MTPGIIVLFGGRSDERHVSVASAQNITRILGRPRCWFWAPDGAIHDVTVEELLAHERPFENDYQPARPAIWPALEPALDAMRNEDTVFLLALHGGEGEDGTVQKMMETRAIAFTGSGSAASAAAFDKGRAKNAVRGRVRTAESCVVRNEEELRNGLNDLLARHRRVVLKPLAGGSSRGLHFVDAQTDLEAVLAQVLANRVPYVAEQYVAGRELTIGVADLGNGPQPLPVIEIEVDPGFAFDYAGKYLGKGTREICPANIPDALREEAQRTALIAHETLGCEGYSRTDAIAGDDGVYFLELNTLPGMTTSSLVPQQLREAGTGMREFLERQVELAVQRRQTGTGKEDSLDPMDTARDRTV